MPYSLRQFLSFLEIIFLIIFIHYPSSLNADSAHNVHIIKPYSGFNLGLVTFRLFGYFVPSQGRCKLNVFYSEEWNPDQKSEYKKPVRIFHDIPSRHKALINSPEALALEFTCEEDAKSMTVRKQGGPEHNDILARNIL